MKNLIILISFMIFSFCYFRFTIFAILSIIAFIIYLFAEFRYSLIVLPLYIITKIQGRNFNFLTDLKEIKRVMKLTDKGRFIEELFATKAWSPILSIESVNSPLWEVLRDNYLKFAEYLPSEKKLGIIANTQAKTLLNKKIIDGRDISIATVTVFLKWIFCENELPLNKNKELRNKNELSENSYQFINKFLTEEFLDQIYNGSIEYRKEIALKGYGCNVKKQNSIDIIINLILQSKFKELFEDWKKDVYYSVIMQPLIISPMINMSDIAVALKKHVNEYNPKNYKEFLDFVDMCIFKNHPFPCLERYEESTNTTYILDMNFISTKIDTHILNFGFGPRACLGRVFARIFLQNFFEELIKSPDIYKPEVNHLFSGRDNDDNLNISEVIHTIRLLIKVAYEEYKYVRSLPKK